MTSVYIRSLIWVHQWTRCHGQQFKRKTTYFATLRISWTSVRIKISSQELYYLNTNRVLFCLLICVNGRPWRARSVKSEAVGMNSWSGYILSVLTYEFWLNEIQRSWEARGI